MSEKGKDFLKTKKLKNTKLKQLYPLKFEPILKERIWGGSKLHLKLNKEKTTYLTGESWEISAVEGSVSVVSNGVLKGENLKFLIDQDPQSILGDDVIKKYGNIFPVLIKFIDAQKDLSIQLHPDDELAKTRHNAMGKEEMWYIMEAEKKSQLMFGFKEVLDKKTYVEHVKNQTLKNVLKYESVQTGDVFHIPPGRVHAIGGGILLAEIQQNSDVTYRIYDWDRIDEKGNKRELHTHLAVDAIDFESKDSFKTTYSISDNKANEVLKGSNFSVFILNLTTNLKIKNKEKKSFAIYIAVEGKGKVNTINDTVEIQKGEVLLIPACIADYEIIPELIGIKLLQVFP